jgi:hypothetical protein
MMGFLCPVLQGIQKQLIRSLIKHSTLAVCVTGTRIARGRALASGTVLRDSMGSGVFGCDGLLKSLGLCWEQHTISFARSVTI